MYLTMLHIVNFKPVTYVRMDISKGGFIIAQSFVIVRIMQSYQKIIVILTLIDFCIR